MSEGDDYYRQVAFDTLEQREATIRWIEKCGSKFWCVLAFFPCMRISSCNSHRNNGACKNWCARASATTKQLTANLNGPLLEMVAGYLKGEHNKNIDSLRDGSESKICCSRSRALAALFFPGAPIYKDGARHCTRSHSTMTITIEYSIHVTVSLALR